MGSSPYFGTYATAVYPSPFAITYPAGAGAGDDFKFAFPQTAGGITHTNWYPIYQEPGNMGVF